MIRKKAWSMEHGAWSMEHGAGDWELGGGRESEMEGWRDGGMERVRSRELG